ncbi:uncharacterized protein LOC117551150 isoform X1 [Gymnodraco acuticeps]|uniref:Uncharacterized protein LOC117551150 isoform X1 n=1 Tax=Gymnodraco acuticeps TaxID=8218 RepID=A0A6P8UST7_GYMAC|nr:uncharacterized protein LOC117551150 isoform X1 [Gymnodraco acuticeps]
MAGRLLFVILMYCFHMYQAQDLPPPTLTVNPPVITESDSVTLHCQTPPSVSVSQCYFYTLSGGTRGFSCLKTLTGTELLQMSQQSSPVDVQVKCFYIVMFKGSNSLSPHSDLSSITIDNPLPPTLTVNPPVITETDSVTLHCQTPPSVSMLHCYFYTLTGLIVRGFSCLKTLTGTELLLMSQQRSPAEVQVKCFYTVTFGGSTSPHSDLSSITVHTLRPPTLTVNPPVITETDSVTLHCQTPPSVSMLHCYFYTLTGLIVRGFSCLKTLTGTELLKMSQQRSPVEVQVKCLYTVKHGGSTSPSPHSDPSSINIYNTVEKESSTTQSIAPSKDSTGLTVISPYPFPPVTPAKQTSGWTVVMSKNTGSSSSSSPTPVKAASAEIWKFVAVVAGCGVAVGVILLVSALLCNNKITAGPDEVKRQDTKVEYSDTYHMYCPEEPAASDLMMGQMYSKVQSH